MAERDLIKEFLTPNQPAPKQTPKATPKQTQPDILQQIRNTQPKPAPKRLANTKPLIIVTRYGKVQHDRPEGYDDLPAAQKIEVKNRIRAQMESEAQKQGRPVKEKYKDLAVPETQVKQAPFGRLQMFADTVQNVADRVIEDIPMTGTAQKMRRAIPAQVSDTIRERVAKPIADIENQIFSSDVFRGGILDPNRPAEGNLADAIISFANQLARPASNLAGDIASSVDPRLTNTEALASQVGVLGTAAGAITGLPQVSSAIRSGKSIARGAKNVSKAIANEVSQSLPRPANFDLESINAQLDQAIGNVQPPSNVIQSLPGVEGQSFMPKPRQTQTVPQPETIVPKPVTETPLMPDPTKTTFASQAGYKADATVLDIVSKYTKQPERVQQWVDEASAKGFDTPEYVNQKTLQIKDNPKTSLQPAEVSGFTMHLMRQKSRILEMKARGEIVADLEDNYREIRDALQQAGSTAGRELRSFALGVDESMDIVNQVYRAEKVKGAKLSAEEYQALETKIANANKVNEELTAQVQNLIAQVKELEPYAKAQRVAPRKGGRAASEQTRRELMNVLGSINAGVDPAVIPALSKHIKALIRDGIENVDDILQDLKGAGLPDADAQDIRNALNYTEKRDKSSYQIRIAAIRDELKALDVDNVVASQTKLKRLEAQLKRLESNVAKEPGTVIPDTPEIANVKKQIRIQRLVNESKRLEDILKTGNIPEEAAKRIREIDNEILAAQLKRDRLRDEVKAYVNSRKPKTKLDTTEAWLDSFALVNPTARIFDFISNAANVVSYGVEAIPRNLLINKIAGAPSTAFDTARASRVLDRTKLFISDDWKRLWGKTDVASAKKYGSQGNLGTQVAGVTDLPFKSFYNAYFEDLLAETKARRELGRNASKQDVFERRDAILRDRESHPDIIMQAEEMALWKTFNSDNSLSTALQRMTSGFGPAGKLTTKLFLTRFSRVLTNVAGDIFDRTGMGFIRGGVKQIGAKLSGNDLSEVQRLIIADQYAKAGLGSAILAAGYFLGDKIDVNVKGEKNKYLDFGDWEKMGGPAKVFLLGMAMNPVNRDKISKNGAGEVFNQLAKTLFENPLTSNVQDLVELANEPTLGGAASFGSKKTANIIIPAVVRDAATRMDAPDTYGFMTGREVVRERSQPAKTYKAGDTTIKVPSDFARANRGEMDAIINIIAREWQSKIPFARQMLPVKESGSK